MAHFAKIDENNKVVEVLVIDKNGQSSITKDSSLLNGLGYSEKLWKNKERIVVLSVFIN